jgi:type IV pilus assembly protein PilV
MKAQGFSLIEVLVAVLVLAIGLLGVAALQINATRANQSAELRSQASMLAYFMLDAMRANRDAALAGSYNLTSMTCTLPSACTLPSDPFDCTLSSGTLAQKDQCCWLGKAKETKRLGPSACGKIECDNTGNCTVTLQWDDNRAGGASDQVIEVKSRL